MSGIRVLVGTRRGGFVEVRAGAVAPGERRKGNMAGRECYHCEPWVEAGAPHDCWTTTEAALTRDLPEDLREAWFRAGSAATVSGSVDVWTTSIPFSVVSTVVSIFS